MATDKSEPRVGVIASVGILSIVTLLATRTALVSYFDHMVRAEEATKVGGAKPEALLSLRADEASRLAAGSMPIDKAMQQLTTMGRLSASPSIVPSASRDVAPLAGWSMMPGEVPPAMTAPPPVAPAADAGAPDAAPAAGGKAAPGKPAAPNRPATPGKKKAP